MMRVAQKYAMHTTVTGNAQRQKDSLVGEGPLNLPPQNWLASVCGFLGPGTTPGWALLHPNNGYCAERGTTGRLVIMP